MIAVIKDRTSLSTLKKKQMFFLQVPESIPILNYIII